jgi:hypothetical protein
MIDDIESRVEWVKTLVNSYEEPNPYVERWLLLLAILSDEELIRLNRRCLMPPLTDSAMGYRLAEFLCMEIRNRRALEEMSKWQHPKLPFPYEQRPSWLDLESHQAALQDIGPCPAPTEQSMIPAADVFGWLHTQHEFIRQAAQDAPRDVLTLEIDEPIDNTQAQDNQSAESVPDAV